MQPNSTTFKYRQTAGGSLLPLTLLESNSTHVTVELQEFCISGANTYCPEGTINLILSEGFKNPRSITASFSNFF